MITIPVFDDYVLIVNFFPDVLSSSVRPHLNNSLPHAPSDQFRTETAFLLVCDGGLGRSVQVLLQDIVVGSTHCLHVLPLVLQPCFSALELVASTCYARIASLSPLLSPPPRVARGVFSCLQLAMFFCSWVLGSLPWLFSVLGFLSVLPTAT